MRLLSSLPDARLARMDLARKKLGLMLSTGPQHVNLETALGLATAALGRGAAVYLYLIDDGVTALAEPRVRALPAQGAKLFVCAYGCQKRRIPSGGRQRHHVLRSGGADRHHQRHRSLHRAQLSPFAVP